MWLNTYISKQENPKIIERLFDDYEYNNNAEAYVLKEWNNIYNLRYDSVDTSQIMEVSHPRNGDLEIIFNFSYSTNPLHKIVYRNVPREFSTLIKDRFLRRVAGTRKCKCGRVVDHILSRDFKSETICYHCYCEKINIEPSQLVNCNYCNRICEQSHCTNGLCEECSSKYGVCSNCGRTVVRSTLQERGGKLLCESCRYVSLGTIMSSNPNDDDDFPPVIGNVKGLFTDNNYTYGFEIEREQTRKLTTDDADAMKTIKDFTYFTYDGSLRNGIEVVTLPFTGLKGERLFKKTFDVLDSCKLKGEETCGLHCHVSPIDIDKLEKLKTDKYLKRLYRLCFFIESSLADITGDRINNRYCKSLRKLLSPKKARQVPFDVLFYNQLGSSTDVRTIKSEMEALKENAKYGKEEGHPSCRYHWINFHSLFYRGTLENRLCPANVTYKQALAWARLTSTIIDIALLSDYRWYSKAKQLSVFEGVADPVTVFSIMGLPKNTTNQLLSMK